MERMAMAVVDHLGRFWIMPSEDFALGLMMTGVAKRDLLGQWLVMVKVPPWSSSGAKTRLLARSASSFTFRARGRDQRLARGACRIGGVDSPPRLGNRH